MLATLTAWDTQLFYTIHALRSSFLDAAMPLLSQPSLGWVIGGVVFAIWSVRIVFKNAVQQRFRYMIFGMVLVLATSGLTEVVHHFVKYEVRRARPGHVLPNMHQYSREGWRYNTPEFAPKKYKGDSFFSGHAAHSAALVVSAVSICPPLSPLVYAVPLVVGYSRIYMGRHYPLDIVCGWAAGAAIALAVRRVSRRWLEKFRPK
jgi:Membrane-associated phospholipid phosphatase